jgi:hypothetical protein
MLNRGTRHPTIVDGPISKSIRNADRRCPLATGAAPDLTRDLTSPQADGSGVHLLQFAVDLPRPSDWLLRDEPDLTPDQVWAVLATAGQGGIKVLRTGVVIADTAEQVQNALAQCEWDPLGIFTERALDDLMARVTAAPAHVVRNWLGQPGTERFALIYPNPASQPPIRLFWVLAASAHAAEHAWKDIGEKTPPPMVTPLAEIELLRDKARAVRSNRGNGAMFDGRVFANWEKRMTSITKERIGPEVYEANRRKLAEKLAGISPTEDQIS